MPLLPKNADLGWTPYAWLVYLGIFLVYPIVREADAAEWLVTATVVAVFLALWSRQTVPAPIGRGILSGRA